MLCPTDKDCPRCFSKSIAVSTLKGPTIAAVLIQDLIRRLPHMTLDDGVCPNAYRTSFYGNFPFATLNRKDFKDRGGKFYIDLTISMTHSLYPRLSIILTNSVHDLYGHRLITRVYFGDNYGKDDEGSPLRQRQFVEVSHNW